MQSHWNNKISLHDKYSASNITASQKKWFMHPFNKCLLATYRVPSAILKDGGKAMKKVLPVLKQLVLMGELEETTHINKMSRTFNKNQ